MTALSLDEVRAIEELADDLRASEERDALAAICSTLFGDAVRSARRSKGWTQERLAREVRLHRHSIVTIEGGHREPRLAVVLHLAALLDIDLTAIAIVGAAA